VVPPCLLDPRDHRPLRRRCLGQPPAHATDVPRRDHPDRRRVGRRAALPRRPDAGCSIKDSFSTLDLTAAGFSALFDAQWFWRAAALGPAGGALRWERVEEPDDLRTWSLEHGGGSTFHAALLDEPTVTILAGRDRGGRLAAGAVATEGRDAVGISNVFAVGAGDNIDAEAAAPAFADAFAGATAAIIERFPDCPLVGYLSSDDLAAAQAAGFETICPLRIWLLDG
jgi:hypothetical protein